MAKAISRKKKIAQLQAVPTKGFVYDADTHTYLYDGKQMTGCTTILNVLSKPALISWSARMCAEYILNNSDVQDDGEHCITTIKVIEEGKTAHAKFRDKRASEGTDLHSLVEQFIKDCIEMQGGKVQEGNRPPENNKYYPIRNFIEWAIKENIRFLSSEQQFYSTSLFVAGTADMTFEKDGKRYVGDLKNKKKIYGRDAQFQCAGYATMAEEMGERPFDGFCIIRLWENEIETIWSGDTYGDREGFLACVKLYRLINN